MTFWKYPSGNIYADYRTDDRALHLVVCCEDGRTFTYSGGLTLCECLRCSIIRARQVWNLCQWSGHSLIQRGEYVGEGEPMDG